MHQLIVFISICLSFLATPSLAYAKWTRMTTEHFVFVGDASEQSISKVATRLEVFREVISRAFVRPTPSSIPTVVFVFKNDKSFTPFKPMFQGTPMAVAGVFGGSDELNCIAVNAEMDSEAYGVIFHESAHFLIRNALGSVPLWANEGLAQFYETFETRDGGRSALIGMPSLKGLRDLQAANTLVPIQELLAVKTGSPVYNQGERRGVFFAEAWALVHYLMLGNPERGGQLQEYLAAVRQGQSSGQAFASVFGGDSAGLERELREVPRRLSLNVIQLKFDQKISAERAQAEVITEADAAGYLGELLYHFHREEDAKTYLREVALRRQRAWRRRDARAHRSASGQRQRRSAASRGRAVACAGTAHRPAELRAGNGATRRARRCGRDVESARRVWRWSARSTLRRTTPR